MSSDARELAQRLNAATVHLMRALRQESDAGDLAAEHRTTLAAVVFAGPMPIGALARRERTDRARIEAAIEALEHLVADLERARVER